jgi:hypothetical protein
MSRQEDESLAEDDSEHRELHERLNRLHTTSAASALIEWHGTHGGCRYETESDESETSIDGSVP